MKCKKCGTELTANTISCCPSCNPEEKEKGRRAMGQIMWFLSEMDDDNDIGFDIGCAIGLAIIIGFVLLGLILRGVIF